METDPAETPETERVLFASRFMDRYAGALVKDPVTALIELVANAWDARATRVEITWPDREGGRAFSIKDNGHGMTAAEFQSRWCMIDYDRLEGGQAKVIEVKAGETVTRRRTYGRNGRGRHAAFFFGDPYTVTTWSGGKESAYSITRGVGTHPFLASPLGTRDRDASGTILTAAEATDVGLSADAARSAIGMRFIADPTFEILLDGMRVEFEHIPKESRVESEIEVEGVGKIRLWAIDTRISDRTAKQHGIAWRVHKRLVGECTWRDSGLEIFLDGRTKDARRRTFIIFADALEPAVLPDWTGFDRNHPHWEPVNKAVQEKIRDDILAGSKDRRAQTRGAVRQEYANAYRRMSPLSRERWSAFIDDVLERCPSIGEPQLTQIAGILANLELAHSRYTLLEQLGALKTGNLDKLSDVLKRWTVESAKAVLDELAGRLQLIKDMMRKTADPAADELHELQPLFERGLWIFGPEFETIEYTSNKGMTTVVRELFGNDATSTLDRPDFVVLADGTVGFYSYPRFGEDMAEEGVEKLVIVELKKPGVTVGATQKEQGWKYVKLLYEAGAITRERQVTCFVLGSQLDVLEAQPRQEGPVTIKPMLYQTILDRAHSRTFKLYEHVKEAPFLKDENIEEHLRSGVGAQETLDL
jgi:Histidine kinase-, DNA gyrase B-, and HSP90-like ATPase